MPQKTEALRAENRKPKWELCFGLTFFPFSSLSLLLSFLSNFLRLYAIISFLLWQTFPSTLYAWIKIENMYWGRQGRRGGRVKVKKKRILCIILLYTIVDSIPGFLMTFLSGLFFPFSFFYTSFFYIVL